MCIVIVLKSPRRRRLKVYGARYVVNKSWTVVAEMYRARGSGPLIRLKYL